LRKRWLPVPPGRKAPRILICCRRVKLAVVILEQSQTAECSALGFAGKSVGGFIRSVTRRKTLPLYIAQMMRPLSLRELQMSVLELLLALSTALFVFFALKTVQNGR